MAYSVGMSLVDDDAVMKQFHPPISGRLLALLALGDAVSADERAAIPRELLVETEDLDKLPDVLGWEPGPFLLSPVVRDMLEALEPNVHDFLRVQVKSRLQKGASERAYWLLICPPRIDAIVVDQTDFYSGFGRAGYEADIKRSAAAENTLAPGGTAHLSQRLEAVWTVDARAITGRHFWRLPMRLGGVNMCSDEFRQRFISEGCRGWEFGKHSREA